MLKKKFTLLAPPTAPYSMIGAFTAQWVAQDQYAQGAAYILMTTPHILVFVSCQTRLLP